MRNVRPKVTNHWLRPRDGKWLSNLLFYGYFARWPAVMLVVAFAGAESIYHGGLPLAGFLHREWTYHEAEQAFDRGRNGEALYQIRETLLGTPGHVVGTVPWLIWTAISALLALCGYLFFMKTKRGFADVL